MEPIVDTEILIIGQGPSQEISRKKIRIEVMNALCDTARMDLIMSAKSLKTDLL